VLAVFAVIAIPLLYAGAYLALVIPSKYEIDPARQDGLSLWETRDIYRLGGESSERFFWLANELDRRVRPTTWAFDPFSDGSDINH
jgi:hypothetical protein